MGLPRQAFVTLADYDGMRVLMEERSLLGKQLSVRTSPGPQAFAGREGVFDADLLFRVYRHQPVVELPLQPGAAWVDGPNRIMVLDASLADGNRVTVDVRVQWIRLREERSLDSPHWLLVNRERGEAFVSTESWNVRWTRVYPFATQDLRVTYRNRGDDDSAVPMDDEWLAGASVLVLTRETVGQVTKHLRLEGFRLWPDADELTQP